MALTIRGQRSHNETSLDTVVRKGKAPGRARIGARPTRAAARKPLHEWYLPCKHLFDYTAALLLAIVAAPIVLLAALLVKLTSRGPAFYSQVRVGEKGKVFTIYKVRTMIHNCESLTGPRWAIPGDPRVTLVGRLLRVSHLDELPQLWNVLKGDMSLIGPRRKRPEFVPELELSVPGYCSRLAVRPGVTGLAQINLPADTDIESVRRKLTCDLFYIRHMSPWLDLKVLLSTALFAVGVPFRWSRWMFRVPSLMDATREARFSGQIHQSPAA